MKQKCLIRIPTELKEWLVNEANKKGLNLTSIILVILNEYREKKEA